MKLLFTDFLKSKNFIYLVSFIFIQLYLSDLLSKSIDKNNFDILNVALPVLIVVLLNVTFSYLCSSLIFFHFAQIKNQNTEEFLTYSKNNFSDWFTVHILTQIRVLLFGLLLIIPGVIEAVRLSLSIPMVFLDKRMNDSFFNPIMESRKVLRLNSSLFWKAFMVFIPLNAVILILTLASTGQNILFLILLSISLALLSLIYYSYFANLLFNLNKSGESN